MMLLKRCGGIWWVVSLCLACAVAFTASSANAEGQFVRELLLSLVHPSELGDLDSRDPGNVERILSVPSREFREGDNDVPLVFAEEPAGRNASRASQRNGKSRLEWRLPSLLTPVSADYDLPDNPAMVAALYPPALPASTRTEALLDSGESLASTGGLVGDARKIYSRLEIRVNRSTYTLELYAYRGEKEKLLYSTRVGLGSPDFPTPRGTYFVMRIYDDKPLWIPPQDRWWAWGQRPSHSVYGGHMMPFFTKVRDKSAGSVDQGTDLVEPKMKMVDAGMYRIHGTDSPWSVGSGQSHGCVRMLNSTVAQLADNLKMYAGTTARGRSANGPYVNLARPVKLILY